MEQLAEDLMKQLNCETVFTIPIQGGINVAESVVVTWIIMAVLVIASILFTRNLKVENIGKRQMVVETIVGGLENMIEGMDLSIFIDSINWWKFKIDITIDISRFSEPEAIKAATAGTAA
jgi:F0F1-type ATP synthase membrane subunit a